MSPVDTNDATNVLILLILCTLLCAANGVVNDDDDDCSWCCWTSGDQLSTFKWFMNLIIWKLVEPQNCNCWT